METQSKMTMKQETLEVVICELERNLAVLQANYQQAVSNLSVLRQQVDTDDLTQLLRKGAFMRRLHNLLQNSKNTGEEVALLMIDVDFFKRVNDTHGHQTGDVVLERVSALVRGFMRAGDLAGRFGGEEIIVAVQASRTEAKQLAENIRMAVEAHVMESRANQKFSVTLSVGVSTTRTEGFEQDRLMEKADQALYRAKKSGRNRVEEASIENEGQLAVVLSLFPKTSEKIAA